MNQEVKKKYDKIENANNMIRKKAINNMIGSENMNINNTFHVATFCTSFFINKVYKNKNIKNVRKGRNEIKPIRRVYSN
jgi:hypothetical protein